MDVSLEARWYWSYYVQCAELRASGPGPGCCVWLSGDSLTASWSVLRYLVSYRAKMGFHKSLI